MSARTDDDMARFNARLAELRADPADARAALEMEGVFAAGALMGAGFPGASAAVCVLMEHRFPNARYPWSNNGR